MNNLQKIRQIANVFGYKTKAQALKALKKGRYLENDGYITNGMWAFPKLMEPKEFRDHRTSETESKIKEMFDEVIAQEKHEMSIDRISVGLGGLNVVLKCDEFESHVNPEYLSLIAKLKWPLTNIKIWQKEPLKPVLIDNDDVSIMLIMPMRVSEEV